MKKLILFIQAMCFLFFLSCQEEPTIKWGDEELDLKFASTDAERQQGLQDHPPLEGNQGMLFIYSKPQKLQFWMKNVTFPIDLAYFNEKGEVISIHAMIPLNLEPVASPEPAKFVLEMRQGWFEEKKISAGERWPYLTQKLLLQTD